MKKVLLIDDEKMIVETTSEMLEILGYEVFSALNGNSGIELVRSEQPDILILDCHLPDISPEEVISRVIELECQPRIIISSGVNITEFQDSKINSAVSGFLNKPFDLEALEQALKE